MKRLFNHDSPFWTFMSQLADLVVLNVLWLICCIPVVTVGASTTAMYRVTLNMTDESGGSVAKSFFSAFRSNFKQATAVWLLIFAVAAVLGVDFILIWNWDVSGKLILFVFFTLSAFITLSVFAYVFPLIAYFKNTVGNMLKNAFLLSIRYLPKTIIMLVLNAFPFLLLAFFSSWFFYFGFIWLLFGFSAIAYVNSRLLLKIFKGLPSAPAA